MGERGESEGKLALEFKTGEIGQYDGELAIGIRIGDLRKDGGRSGFVIRVSKYWPVGWGFLWVRSNSLRASYEALPCRGAE